MTYVLDTSSWQQLFGCYNSDRFPSLWRNFNILVFSGAVISTEQVLNEIRNRDRKNGEVEWANEHNALFPGLTNDLSLFLSRILAFPRFGHTVPTNTRGPSAPADVFLIALAADIGGAVITEERRRGQRVTIPHICDEIDFPCLSLQGMMELEHWRF